MNNLELFNKFWKELEQYKNDKVALGRFVDLLIANNPSLLEYKKKIALFLQKIDYVDVLDASGQIGTKIGTCWEWTASKNKDAYSKFAIKNNPFKVIPSHRFMQFLVNPDFDLDSELKACHSCDNPSCNNPNHLWLGTDQDNMTDKVNKGRQPTGSNHGRSKLTDDQVWAIFYDPRINEVIAVEYGVSIGIISEIKTGIRKLTDLTKSLPKNQNALSLESKTIKLTKENYIEILRLYPTGLYLQKELAIMFGVSNSVISNVINGKSLKRFGL
jgi:hypothetical protein